MRSVSDGLPLYALLSQVLVAFTVEFDNEFEHRMPHRTARSRAAGEVRSGPWLVSMVMYLNFLQYVGEDGIPFSELQRRARLEKLSLAGMERWGYVSVGAGAPKERMIRLTSKGRIAQQVWEPLFAEIETRWRERFGAQTIGRLRELLQGLVGGLDGALPEYLPVLGYGLVSEVPAGGVASTSGSWEHLPTLLARVLLAFALEFERESDVSLAISANVMRILLEGDGVRVRDLPHLSGVSKEAISMALTFLTARGYLVVEADPTARGTKTVRLTAKGRAAQDVHGRLLQTIEGRWGERFGDVVIGDLTELLLGMTDERLWRGIKPYPDGWRAAVRQSGVLPHFPMVLHRGGYPDGS